MKEKADLEAALAACAAEENGVDAPPPLPPPAEPLPPIADGAIDAEPVPVPHDGTLFLDPTPSGCVVLTNTVTLEKKLLPPGGYHLEFDDEGFAVLVKEGEDQDTHIYTPIDNDLTMEALKKPPAAL